MSQLDWGTRHLLLVPKDRVEDFQIDDAAAQRWQMADVAEGLPQVYAATSETFVAQMLNLDLLGAIAFDKGCYLGQEVVLRGTFRGQMQKGLVQLALPPGAGPGAVLRAGEQEVGVVTSAADTPEGRLGLGYLRRAHWKEGARLATTGGEAVVRRVLVTERDG